MKKSKKFAFVNDAAEREYKDLPDKIQDEFGKDLRRIRFGEEPRSPTWIVLGLALLN